MREAAVKFAMKAWLTAAALFSLSVSGRVSAQVLGEPTLPEVKQEASKSGSQEPARELPPYLSVIGKTAKLQEYRRGSQGELAAALREVLKKGSAKEPKVAAETLDALDWISQNGSPAGKVYAILLKDRLDAASTNKSQALQALSSEEGSTRLLVENAGSTCHYTVEEIVIDQLSKAPVLKFLPGKGEEQ
ncbi:MAG: hypothetical protein K2Y32_18875 [Candidatus Obscuribacterales bacterium]|nr:hypothetical protein [Candidatus Obscuribacterales bacterium]